MTSSEFNDNRPQDGHDEREQRRAEQECADYHTIDRYLLLMRRFCTAGMVSEAAYLEVAAANLRLGRLLTPLWDKEGF